MSRRRKGQNSQKNQNVDHWKERESFRLDVEYSLLVRLSQDEDSSSGTGSDGLVCLRYTPALPILFRPLRPIAS